MAGNSDRQEAPSQSERDDAGLELARIVERSRIIRWIAVCACIAVGVIAIVTGIVLIASEPKWWQLVLTIVASLVAPSVVAGWAIRSRFHYVKKHHGRVVDMEVAFDAKRTSSKPKRGDAKRTSSESEGSNAT